MPAPISKSQLPAWLQGASRMFGGGPYDDASFLSPGAGQLVLNSFTGADMACYAIMPEPPNKEEVLTGLGHDPQTYSYPAITQFAELETISISSARSVFPVRRLGESHVHKYTRGGRTIAGTMVFTTFSRDVFSTMYRLHGGENFSSNAPFFVDQIPPFHLLLSGINEYGVRASAALINVTLSNWGTTFSVHDLKVESTYTYVAQFFFPLVQDYKAFERIVKNYAGMYEKSISDAAMRSKFKDPLTKTGLAPMPTHTEEDMTAISVMRRLRRTVE